MPSQHSPRPCPFRSWPRAPHPRRTDAHSRVLSSTRLDTAVHSTYLHASRPAPPPPMDVAPLRAEIKAWERDFRASHGRDPSLQEIKDQPHIGTSHLPSPQPPRSPPMQPQSISSTSPSPRPAHRVLSPNALPLPLPHPLRHVTHLPHPSYPRLEPSRSILPPPLPTHSLLSRTERSSRILPHHHNVHLINRVQIHSLLHPSQRTNHMPPVAPLL